MSDNADLYGLLKVFNELAAERGPESSIYSRGYMVVKRLIELESQFLELRQRTLCKELCKHSAKCANMGRCMAGGGLRRLGRFYEGYYESMG